MIFFFRSGLRREKREKEGKKAMESLGRARATCRNSSERKRVKDGGGGGRKEGTAIEKLSLYIIVNLIAYIPLKITIERVFSISRKDDSYQL